MTESPHEHGSTTPSEVMASLERQAEQVRARTPKVMATAARIEQTRREAEASGELVALSFEGKVRRRFTRLGPLPSGGDYQVTIRMEDGRQLVESLTLTPDPPVLAQHLTFNLAKFADEAVRNEALAMTDWSEPGSVDDLFDRALVEARRARYRRVTPERLREVLDQYEHEDGIKNVMRKQHTSERNARRLLARARKELQ